MRATIILNGGVVKIRNDDALRCGGIANICVHGDNFIEIKIKLLYNCMKISS